MLGSQRKTANKPKTEDEKNLPPRFTEKVLQLEMDIEYHTNLSNVKQLMNLYSQAIEHYEQSNDPKQAQYRERMEKLLRRRGVLAILRSDQTSDKRITEKDLKRYRAEQDFGGRSPSQRLASQMSIKNEQRKQRSLNRSLNNSLNRSRESKADNQNRSVYSSRLLDINRLRSAEPIGARKRAPKPPRTHFKWQGNAQAHDMNYSFEADKVDFESETDKLMETFDNRKKTMICEIKGKYLPQIQELESQNSEVVQLVVDGLKWQMEDECAKAVMNLESEKNKAIKDLKQKAAATKTTQQ